MSTRWARAAPAAELHVAVEPEPAARRSQGAGGVHHVAFRIRRRRVRGVDRAARRACACPPAARSTATTSAASTSASRTASSSRSPPTGPGFTADEPLGDARPEARLAAVPRAAPPGHRGGPEAAGLATGPHPAFRHSGAATAVFAGSRHGTPSCAGRCRRRPPCDARCTGHWPRPASPPARAPGRRRRVPRKRSRVPITIGRTSPMMPA